MIKRPTLFIALAGIVLAGGCGGDDATTQPAGNAAPTAPVEEGEPVSGGEIAVSVTGDTTSLDPKDLREYAANIYAGPLLNALYDSLVYWNPVSEKLEYQIARSITPNDDLTVWTIALRNGVKFSDGTPFNAEAVKFNFERHQDPDLASLSFETAKAITQLNVKDDLTLQVTLDAPNAGFPNVLAQSGMGAIGSPTAIKSDPDAFLTAPVGAGAFKVESWTRDDRLVLVRNPDYWNAPLPYLDRLIIRPIADINQRYDTLAAGEIQMAIDVGPQNGERGSSDPNLAFYTTYPHGGSSLEFNVTKPPFDDYRVRHAVQVGISTDGFNDAVWDGLLPPLDNWFNEDSTLHSDRTAFPEHDPELAQELFDEYAADTGGPATFALTWSNSSNRVMAEELQVQLLQYDNVEVELDLKPPTQWIAERRNLDFTAIWANNNVTNSLAQLYARFHSTGIRNTGGVNDPVIDSALESYIGTADPDEQRKFATKAVEQVIAQAYEAPFTHTARVTGYWSRLRGIDHSFGDGVPRFDGVWIAPE